MKKDAAMLLRISCPKCGKLLSAPPELVGEVVACPGCSNRFRVRRPAASEPAAPPAFAPPNPNLYPPGTEPAAGRAGKPADAPAGTATSEAASAEAPPVSEPPRTPKRVRTARFIERDPNATPLKLGADGQLPDLALRAEKKRAENSAEAKSANPLLLIGVLCVSVAMSVAILLIDEPAPGAGRGKMEARRTVERLFDSWDHTKPPDREIRDLLARALQAYNRGDVKSEKVYYRRVMDLLNREDAPKYGGYTGEDDTLKEALTELLR